MAAKAQPIIVIKKKGGHGGHHGGAWKVAYADFVTAMMALFIVLWLMGSERTGEEGGGRILQRSQGNGEPAGHHDVGKRRRRVTAARPEHEAAAGAERETRDRRSRPTRNWRS